jgi:cellulose synthase/poly-beta-1,6-N-acetylglucosamine synthase-like glycosyltransferase
LQRASLLIFLAWVSLVWLQGIYTAILLLVRKRGKRRSPGQLFDQTPALALLYTTMNDFCEKAALSCIHQEYPDFDVFLLDDSSEVHQKSLVDQFHKRFPDITTVIRRPSRKHFKAGNLNHALGIIGCDYEFFAVCDADGVLPPDFLGKTLEYFVDENVGFVQARQRPVLSSSASRFGFDLIAAGEIYWEQVFSRTARTGFVMFHGHGGIIRTKVWREVGGFPPLVSEDLAFSTRIRQLGYLGVIADDVVCDEDFPPSRAAFCKRQLKYVRGTCEHLKRDMVPFLCSLRVAWFEKADRLLASLNMVSAPLLVIFLVDFLFFLPLAFPPETASMSSAHTNVLRLLDVPMLGYGVSQSIHSFSFYSMTLLAIFLPSLPAVVHLRKDPRRLGRYILCCVAVSLSSVFRQAWDALVVTVSGRNFFPVTGAGRCGSRTMQDQRRAAVLIGVDTFALVALTALGFATRGIGAVAPFCVAIGTGLAADSLGWEHWFVRKLLSLPLAAVLAASALGFIAILTLGSR